MSDVARGRFVWYDLMTPDPAGAEAFYTRLLGWGTEIWNPGAMPYTMFTNGGGPFGGIRELPPQAVAGGARPHWLGYVTTPDVVATAARAAELGAKTMVPAVDIPAVGTFSVLADPHGALFAIYDPANDIPEPAGRARVGDVEWHELATSDPEAAFTFYAELFGWEKTEAMDMGENGIYQMIGRTRQHSFGAVYKQPPEMPGAPAWLFYVRVADLDAALEQVAALGGQVQMGPHDVPDGDRIAQCLDPQGGPFALHWSARHDD